MMRYYIVVLTVVILSSPIARAQQAPPAEPPMITRVYDVTNLLQTVPEYPANALIRGGLSSGDWNLQTSPPPGLDFSNFNPYRQGEQEAGGSAQPPASRQSGGGARELIGLIQETISQESWVDSGNGRRWGTIREFSGRLVVTQIPDVHTQIEKLLSSLQQDTASLVQIRAVWILLAPADAANLWGKSIRYTPDGAQVVEKAILDAMLAGHPHVLAQMLCYDRQRTHIGSNRQRTVLSSMQPVVGDGAVGYNLNPERIDSGAKIELAPFVLPGRDRIVLDIQATLTGPSDAGVIGFVAPKDGTTVPMAGFPSPSQLERVDMLVQQFATTVRIPVDQPVLLNAITPQPSQLSEDMKTLYFIVEAHVSEEGN